MEGAHLDKEFLRIAPERLITADVQNRVELGRKFDLALCLEVGGYLHSDGPENLVRSLVDAAPVVLFSAPIPFQFDERVMINQQWQDYWAKLFIEQGFEPVHCIRRTIWDDDEIAWWYRQNAVLYVRKDHLGANEALRAARERNSGLPARLVHPQHYLWLRSELRKGPASRALASARSRLGRVLPAGLKAALRKLRAEPA